jgi:hypothetical protein
MTARGGNLFAALAAATAATVVLLGSSTGAFAQGCAMCGTAVSSPNDPLGRAMALSIVFMLAVPNIIVASIGGWLFYVYRRAARAGRWPSGRNGSAPGGAASSDAGRPGPSSSGEPT